MLTLIAAMTPTRVIGHQGRIPWRCRADMKFFKETTMGHPVIMGRKTWESLGGKPLPGRTNLVVSSRTRDDLGLPGGVLVFPTLQGALDWAEQEQGPDQVFCIGGAQLYREALPVAHRVLLTTVDVDTPGDTHFPELNHEFRMDEQKTRVDLGEGTQPTCFFREYVRS